MPDVELPPRLYPPPPNDGVRDTPPPNDGVRGLLEYPPLDRASAADDTVANAATTRHAMTRRSNVT